VASPRVYVRMWRLQEAIEKALQVLRQLEREMEGLVWNVREAREALEEALALGPRRRRSREAALRLHEAIAGLRAQGLSLPEVAFRLGVDYTTVHWHAARKCKCLPPIETTPCPECRGLGVVRRNGAMAGR